MHFKIELINQKNLLKINNISAERLGLNNLHVTVIRFGFSIAEVEIEASSDIEENTLFISENVINKVKVPRDNIYMLEVIDKEIVLGPYTGIYIGKGDYPKGWKYERLSSFVSNFQEVNGTLCAFTENNVDFNKMEVNGCYYDSYNKIWKRRVLPLPSAINRYGDIRRVFRDRIRGIYGDKYFNFNEMDKWTEMKALRTNELSKKYIPDTIISDNINTFKRFVENHEDVYFKPIRGRQGRNIHRIQKQTDDKYLLTITSINSFNEYRFENLEQLIMELRDKIISAKYILQQTINITIKGRVIDFRIRYEKDIKNNWVLSLFASRVSDPGGVVSNRSAGGTVITPDEALSKYYGYSDEETGNVKQKLIDAGFQIVKAVEESNVNYGKCAVDLGLDQNGQIWHIESNVIGPNDFTTLSFEGYKGLNRVSHLNVMYSKRLARFQNATHTVEFAQFANDKEHSKVIKNYILYLAGRFISKELKEQIFRTIEENNVKIKENEIKRTYVSVKLNISEIDLLTLIKKIRNIDDQNIIKTILYEESTVKKRKVTRSDRSLLKDNKRLSKEVKLLNKEIKQLRTSTSWKLSKPIRLIGKLFK